MIEIFFHLGTGQRVWGGRGGWARAFENVVVRKHDPFLPFGAKLCDPPLNEGLKLHDPPPL